ncbi:TMV resistance protein N-like [Eucalyptus grandis]|uniref:TMV resistance protein N-like n=1 Tax=Eucalyptus grandis TaxID=71139 RepID=UPI00192E7A8E|nr:TMV resistance protein N-like [Eucalyptus grandis]
MLEMPIDQAIQLFSRHAFRSDTPPEGCYNFSKEVVSSIGRLPLTLEVVGSRFANTFRSEWDETLEDLKQVPHRRVRKTLMMSIKRLDDIEKAIFLDIACFCIGEDKTYADYMWRSSGYSPRSAIDVLLLMSLIKIDEFNRFWMHDEVRDLGRYIVKEENFEDAGERRWVRIDENTLDMQSCNKEKQAVRALSLDISYELTAEELAYLPMLSDKSSTGEFGCAQPFEEHDHSQLGWMEANQDFSNFQSLSVISISGCLTPRVPNLSRLKRLQELRLHEFPKLEEIPGLGELESLKFLQISECSGIEQLSDLSKLIKLRHLELLYCRKLRAIEGFKELNSLKNVKIIDCMSLESLPNVPTFTKLDMDWRLRREAAKLTIQSTILGKRMRRRNLQNLK